MRILSLIHGVNAHAGVFGDQVRDDGHELHQASYAMEQPPAQPVAWYDAVMVFGVCLGSQLLAEVAGGEVQQSDVSEIGWYEVELTPEAAGDPIFARLPQRFPSHQWHSYCSTLPPEGVELARNDVCLQAYRVGDRAWGIQFHAEVTRENAEAWISRYDTDPNAVAAGFDPDSARAELADRIEEWNRIGRTLAGGFVEQAEALAGTAAGRATA